MRVPVGISRVFRKDHYTIPNKPVIGVEISTAGKWTDDHTLGDPGIFVDNGSFDIAVGTHAGRNRRRALSGVVIVGAHDNAVSDLCSGCDLAADSNYRVGDFGILHAAPFAQENDHLTGYYLQHFPANSGRVYRWEI